LQEDGGFVDEEDEYNLVDDDLSDLSDPRQNVPQERHLHLTNFDEEDFVNHSEYDHEAQDESHQPQRIPNRKNR
jgi:hypothetical protein